MNPAAIAVFFDKMCSAVLQALICPSDGEGIFGDVSNFGVVESNGRGMLHMHSLIWLAGNLDFFDLKGKLLADSDFARRMIEYLDCVISESIELPDGGPEISRPSTRDFEDDAAYENALRKYGNAVAVTVPGDCRSNNNCVVL